MSLYLLTLSDSLLSLFVAFDLKSLEIVSPFACCEMWKTLINLLYVYLLISSIAYVFSFGYLASCKFHAAKCYLGFLSSTPFIRKWFELNCD